MKATIKRWNYGEKKSPNSPHELTFDGDKGDVTEDLSYFSEGDFHIRLYGIEDVDVLGGNSVRSIGQSLECVIPSDRLQDAIDQSDGAGDFFIRDLVNHAETILRLKKILLAIADVSEDGEAIREIADVLVHLSSTPDSVVHETD